VPKEHDMIVYSEKAQILK